MELLDNLALGFGVAFSLVNLLYAFAGTLLGTLIGVLPGLGPTATIAMLLPSIYTLDAIPALIMLAGIYYGAQYGGSTTAILINVPGEASSVVTAIDGYKMARRGRAGPALASAGLGSFFAGCVGTLVIAAFAPPLTELAFKFGPAEYFSLMVLGLIGAVVLASGSLVKAIAMILLGLLLGQINTDVISGVPRYSFDIPELTDGISFVAIAMGVFGFGEIIANLGRPAGHREVFTKDVRGLWPTRQDFKDMVPAVLRGTALGSVLGVLPGGGAMLSAFAAYTVEKKVPGRAGEVPFGQGNIRGVAGPESANNAGAQTSFIPMLTLGIPPNAVMALMVGAMTIKGIQPGPQVMTSNPQLFWGLIASMWVGNLMLIVLNLPLIGIWIKLLTVPYRILYPAILAFCCIGLYTLSNNTFDVYVGALFGVCGLVFYKLGCEPAPLLLGFILGPMMEESLRRALLLSRGDWSTFVTRPLSAGLLIATALMILVVSLPAIRRQRQEAFQEEGQAPPAA
ncbi:MAG: tripartite tricarboxylate transporter permease [Rubrivivax sp.]|nr:tripartite tricarboxylate transporter permease [Rubrivivax sp.]